MTDAFVKLPDDAANTGKDVLTKLVGDKHLQVVVLADDAGDAVSVAAGRMQVDVQHEQPLTNTQLTAQALATEGTLDALNAKTPALGQALASASVPVVLASDQAPVEVDTGLVQALTNAQATALGLGTESTLQSINTLQVSIDTLIDTLATFCSIIMTQTPRLDSLSRAVVNGSEVTQPVSGTVTANIGTGTLSLLSNITSIGGQQIPYIAQDVPLHLYDKIVVS